MKIKIGRILQYIYIYVLCIIVLLPVLNIFLSAFKKNVEINRSAIFPSALLFENFTAVLKSDIFYSGMLNTIIITGGALILSVMICTMAAYPLARNRQVIYTIVYFIFLSAMMIPSVANMVPLFSLMRQLGLLNSRIGMILLYASNVSMGILLFTSFMKNIPIEIEKAAEIDGCNYFQTFWHITLPLMKPVWISYIMIQILGIWNDFLLPQLFLSERSKQTITLAVFTFRNERGSDWGAIFALMSLVVIVPMVLFILNQKYFLKGMVAGGIKT